jgi:hypothetical protein
MFIRSITIEGNKIVTVTKESDSFSGITTIGISRICSQDGTLEYYSEDDSPGEIHRTIDPNDFINSQYKFAGLCREIARIVEPATADVLGSGSMEIFSILHPMFINSVML